MTSAKINQPVQPQKPITAIHQKLQILWAVWLVYRLVVYPVLVGMATEMGITLGVLMGVLWQVLVLLPAFIFTPAVWRGNSPYPLIILSMMTLVYLASAGVFLVLRIYEHAPVMVWVGFAFETMLLAIINVLLFMLLKRLPPMHKNLSKQLPKQ